jgi:tRNA(fMet)-specific endonuclease VapC
VSYLLDTSTVVGLLNNRPALIRDRLRRVRAKDEPVVISCIVLFELRYGVARSRYRRENEERLRLFLSGGIGVVSFEEADALVAGDLRAALDAEGTPIGPYDVLIAAQALRTGASIVTANVSEFSRVPGLRWEDWTAA